jgi:hypothetical protein
MRVANITSNTPKTNWGEGWTSSKNRCETRQESTMEMAVANPLSTTFKMDCLASPPRPRN